MKQALFTGLFLLYVCLTAAQQADSLELAGSQLIGRQMEHLEGVAETGIDLSELSRGLEEYLEKPLNINTAGKADLKKLVVLNDMQIRNLLDYRNKYGNFLSIYELKHVDGLGVNALQKILPFVVAGPSQEPEINTRKLLQGKHEVLFRYQQKLATAEGYRKMDDSLLSISPASCYVGNPSRLYIRYRYQVRGKIKLGLLAEKDPGEKVFSKNYGPDLFSFHAAYEGKGIIRQAIVGDFHARFGQGLVMWSGLSFSGGSDPASIKRYAPGISPNTSANENTFLRGAGISLGSNKFRMTVLISNKKVDANLVYPDSSGRNAYVSSLQASGYHRTLNELTDRNTLLSRKVGGHLEYRGNWFRLGTTVSYAHYNVEIKNEQSPANIYRFNGKNNLCGGLDFDLVFRRTNIFGEVAVSRNGGWALFSGITHMTENGSVFALSVREYKAAYQNFMAQADGRRDHNANERGIRLMMELPLSKHFTLQTSCDQYSFPWLIYGSLNVQRGQDYRLRVIYSEGMKQEYALKYRFRNITSNCDPQSAWFDILAREQKQELQASARYMLSAFFSGKLHAAYVVKKGLETGYKGAGSLIHMDVYFHPPGKKLRMSLRYALFNTDDYNSRIYAYEHDVLYASSMPAYYGKGTRIYLLAKYSPVRWLDTWLRLSLTHYTDRNIISSGADEIKGNILPEVKFQFRIKLQ